MPNDGFAWKPTRQPIVIDLWKRHAVKPDANWTTVMQWDSYKEREYNGMKFAMKSSSFKAFLDLPEYCH
jgi:hypothetical protein